jgi:hypothetical protein
MLQYILALSFSLGIFAVKPLTGQKPVTLQGKISDQTSGKSLKGVKINPLEMPQRKTITRARGQFSMALPTGDYQVEFTCPGYRPDTIWLAVRQNSKWNIELERITPAKPANK